MTQINGSFELYYEGNTITYTIQSLMNKTCDAPNKEFTWFTFTKDHGSITEKEIDTWDNPEYLVEVYNEVIVPWVIDKKVINSEKFSEFLKVEGVQLDDFDGIAELFNKAEQLNMIIL